jgi:hypothetical protein
MDAVDRKYLLDRIKELIIEHGRVARWGLYVMVSATLIKTCIMQKDIHHIEHQLDRIENQLQQEETK